MESTTLGASARKRRLPVIISFSGIDGSGKTTQIEMLDTRLRQAGLQVRRFAFWDDVAVLTRFRDTASSRLFGSERGVGAPGRPVRRRDKNVRSWYMSVLRLVLYSLDAVSLTTVVLRAKHSESEVVIFDRYLYDELANLSWHSVFIQAYIWLLLKLVPAPDVAYVMDAEPEAARERKPEYPLEFLRDNRVAYLHLGCIGGLTVVSPGLVPTVAAAVTQHLTEALRHTELADSRTVDRLAVP